MFGVLPDWVLQLLSMLFIGFAIKLLDDHLDSEYDICRGVKTLAVRLGRSAFAYGLVLALLAVTFDRSLAIALFFSSYAVGMFMDLRDKLPTRVPAFVESIVALAIATLIAGWQTELFALAFVALVDWVDDIIDYSRDKETGQRNFAHKVGFVEATLLVLLALLVAAVMQPVTTILGFVAFAIISALAELSTEHLWHTSGDSCDTWEGPMTHPIAERTGGSQTPDERPDASHNAAKLFGAVMPGQRHHVTDHLSDPTGSEMPASQTEQARSRDTDEPKG